MCRMLHRRTVLIAVGMLVALGCSSKDRWQRARPAVVKAKGTITHDGQPLADAVINFLPTSGSHAAFARSDAQGRFQLTTFDSNDGAVPGDYKVAVTRIVVEHEPNPKDPE